MKKQKLALTMVLIAVTAFISLVAAQASEITHIQKNETVGKDRFIASRAVKNEGTIKGDLFAAAQSVENYGIVEGDLLCASADLGMYGRVLGDLRVAAGKAVVSGETLKNVNVFTGSTELKSTSVIGGNLVAFSGDITLDGKVKGHSRINASNIVLSGEFFGDVDVNLDGGSVNKDTPTQEKSFLTGQGSDSSGTEKQQTRLTLLPSTVIHGKLTYRGSSEAVIQSGAQIGQFEWVKPTVRENTVKEQKVIISLWEVIRLIGTTGAYFLIALLIYKLAPGIFRRQGDVIGSKPLQVFGLGLLVLLSIIVAVILLTILLLLSIGFVSVQIPLFFASTLALLYVIVFYLSTIPVSLWVGNLLFRERCNLLCRFGAGLVFINGMFFLMQICSRIEGWGTGFSILMGITSFVVLVMGIGAILFGIRDIYTAVRRYES